MSKKKQKVSCLHLVSLLPVLFNMFYKQIILQRGLPFEVKELNEELEKGYADMQAGRTKNAKKAFADIRKDYGL